MAKYVLVVESPAKAKTIHKYLGSDFEVLASYGHVRDLLPKKGAVEPDNAFRMHYANIERNTKHVDHIVKACRQSETVFLATDPDREGEAISWHLAEILQEKCKKPPAMQRVVFHEITKKAIAEAIEHPRTIAMDLVHAQQARRALDYLVGFTLSPLLWKKIRKGLSAGRVQSPALRLIAEREKAIEAFVPQEYWHIQGRFAAADGAAFAAKLHLYAEKKVEQFSFTGKTEAEAAVNRLKSLAQGYATVLRVDKKQRKRQSAPPFITSTLQQEAAKRLGFTTQRTMRVAQQLYEGVDTGTGEVGLITYMRTDSVHLSADAVAHIREYVANTFGAAYCPKTPRVFKTRSKNAQEAHEAIRPTAVSRTPDSVRSRLTDEQFRLYRLIWQRTVASQMSDALFDTVVALIAPGKAEPIDTAHAWKATGSVLVFPGFLKVWQTDPTEEPDTSSENLPPLEPGKPLNVLAVDCSQHFTEPPARFNEASLVKALEEYGIGRPSTYASIIGTLQQREYVILEEKKFKPTDRGVVVSDFLSQYFKKYVDYDFTAELEDALDAVARGEQNWQTILHTFWEPFRDLVEYTQTHVSRQAVTQQPTGEMCPECGKELMWQLGKHSRFIGCSGYPECHYTRSTVTDSAPEPVLDRACPSCGGALKIKKGRYSAFIGCSQYPTCTFTESLEKPKYVDVPCPACKTGRFLERRSRKKGKIFYGCERYPECQYATWDPPVARPCPQCNWPILTQRITQRSGTQWICPQKTCGYRSNLDPESEDHAHT